MNEYFEREILSIENELYQLKTSAQRSAGVIESISKTANIDIPLELEYNTGNVGFARGKAIYQIIPEADSLIIATLDWYHEDVTKDWEPFRTTRAVSVNKVRMDDGKVCIVISVEGSDFDSDGKISDVTRLERGETVIVNVKLTVRSTNDFTLGVYRP